LSRKSEKWSMEKRGKVNLSGRLTYGVMEKLKVGE
jgi:hypothetical protein